MPEQDILSLLFSTPGGTIILAALFLATMTPFIQAISSLRKGKSENGHSNGNGNGSVTIEAIKALTSAYAPQAEHLAALNSSNIATNTTLNAILTHIMEASSRHLENGQNIKLNSQSIKDNRDEQSELSAHVVRMTAQHGGQMSELRQIMEGVQGLLAIQVETQNKILVLLSRDNPTPPRPPAGTDKPENITPLDADGAKGKATLDDLPKASGQ